jgi:hypothetical protein
VAITGLFIRSAMRNSKAEVLESFLAFVIGMA